MRRLGSIVAIGLLTLAGGLAGCRGGDEASTGTGESGIKTGPGVTTEACPNAVNANHGCIYLGIISDLTVGPFKALAVPITDAQKAFWNRVNKAGGIGGYDVDVTTYIRDNKYNPETHNQVYQEIKGKVLALAQTLGSPTTAAIINDLKSSSIVAAPASWTSGWAFEDVIIESGANYCVESMNAIDYAVDTFSVKNVMAVHYPGDYGDDAAGGAKLAAQSRGLTFADVRTDPGVDKQAAAINEIVTKKPDLVILTTAPAEAATVIGQSAARGFTGKFIGTSPTWNPGLIASPAAAAIKQLYLQTAPWDSWGANTPGHKAMQEAIGTSVTPNDGYTSGWVWSYPLKAALTKAVADKDLTREGLLKAVKSLTKVDYEGMLPEGSGNYAAGPDSGQVRVTAIYKPDDAGPTKTSQVKALFTGQTAKTFKLDKPCYEQLK